MREEVLEHMIQEGTNDESESSPDIPEQVEEETYQQYDDHDFMNDDVPTEVQVEDVPQNSPAKRNRCETSENEAEEEHPAKRVRIQARAGIEKQAERMLARSSKSLKPLSPGDNVAVPVSQFDRSNDDPPNVIGVILSIDDRGLLTVGTRSGKINGKLSRSQVEPTNFKGLQDQDVPANIVLSLREIVRDQSVVNGQGFTKCNCKGDCLKTCSCFKKGLHCNSACHKKTTNHKCKNFDI